MILTKKSRDKILKNIGFKYIEELDDELLLAVYQVLKDRNERIKTRDAKIDVLLEFLNDILKNTGKSEIVHPSEFSEIDKDVLHEHENIVLLEKHEKKIFSVFGKKLFKNYSANSDKKDVLLKFIKFMVEDVGFTLGTQRLLSTDKDGKQRQHTVYSITCNII